MVKNMTAAMKECTKPHALMHTLTGVGLGLLLAGAISSFAANGVILGIILVAAGIVGDMMVNPAK